MRKFFIFKGLVVIGVVTLASFIFTNQALAATNISSTDKWAWNDVAGWINFYSTNSVNVTDPKIEGYAVFENAPGNYLSLDCATGPPGSGCSTNYYVSNNSNGSLAGWGWSDTYGWVSFCGNATGGSTWDGSTWICPASPTYQTTISPSGVNAGDFAGWAWNDVIGWISFNCNTLDPPDCTPSYKVNTLWRNGPVVSGWLISSTFDTEDTSGVAFNSVMWKGNLGTGQNAVKFQFASSNLTTGGSEGATGPIDPTNRYAWNSIIGWLDFYGAPGGPATVATAKMTRWAVSSGGDFAVDCATTPSGDICATSNFYVSNSTGNLAGWGWNDAYGWVSFCGNSTDSSTWDGSTWVCPASPTYQVTINQLDGQFHGWAWNDIAGWISFNCAEPDVCGTSNYKVAVAGVGSDAWSYIGPDGTSATFYVSTGPDVPVPVVTAHHNNKRYYRYKIYLEFREKLAGDTKPVVDDVIVNWSP